MYGCMRIQRCMALYRCMVPGPRRDDASCMYSSIQLYDTLYYLFTVWSYAKPIHHTAAMAFYPTIATLPATLSVKRPVKPQKRVPSSLPTSVKVSPLPPEESMRAPLSVPAS